MKVAILLIFAHLLTVYSSPCFDVEREGMAIKPREFDSFATDIDVLTQVSDFYRFGRMKVSRILWCTEGSQNSGALTFLRVSVKPLDEYNYPKVLTMNSIGEPTESCYSWRLPKAENIASLQIYNLDGRVTAIQFATFSKGLPRMGSFAPGSDNVMSRTLKFDSLPGYQFIGLYAYFNSGGYIMRLGVNVDTCGDEAAL